MSNHIRQLHVGDKFISDHGNGRVSRVWIVEEISKTINRAHAVTETGMEHWFSIGYVIAQINKSQESGKKADGLLK
jgi:hypothetical protein